jgi:hypothetical protein
MDIGENVKISIMGKYVVTSDHKKFHYSQKEINV